MIKLKCEHCIHKKICIDGANYRNAEACRNYINENDIAPAADVVPVIRCKDCKYYPLCCRIIRSEGNRPDDFCSYGERRNGNGKD